MSGFWQQAERISVPGAGTAVFTVKRNSPLERFTIWAVSGGRVLVNMTFQARINGLTYNPAVNIAAAAAADVIYRSGGGVSENDMIPYVEPRNIDTLDPFVVDVLMTNADATAALVTIFAVGCTHQG